MKAPEITAYEKRYQKDTTSVSLHLQYNKGNKTEMIP